MSDSPSSSWQRPRHSVRIVDALLVCAILVGGWTVMSPRASRDWHGSVASSENDGRRGDGITESSQVLDIWLPEPWLDAARGQSHSFAARDQDSLRKLFQGHLGASLRYGLILRARQANGDTATLTFLREPRQDDLDLREALDVLATAAGKPPIDSAMDYSGATIYVVPARVSRPELLETIRTHLLRPPVSPIASEPPVPPGS